MSVVLPILVNAACVLVLLAIIVRRTKRIIDLETALALQVHAQRLGQEPDTHWESLREARRIADEAARAALAGQEVP